jgi:Zn-dependent peptidase ImmA (M78 family)
MTQKGLASISGIDQGRISRYEGGLKSIPEEEMKILADALSFPITFFLRRGQRLGAETSEIFHRKRLTITATQQKRIDGLINVYRLGIERLLDAVELDSPYSIPQYDIYEYDRDVEQIAAIVRAAWRIVSGPVDNLIARLEAASCMVFRLDFGTDKIDEAVQWVKPLPPIIVVNSRASGDRLRFSLAHALGHLVMHHNEVPYPEMEDEADQFASAFLMPARDIRPELAPVTIEHLLQLKPYWKVSMQALIRRARDIGEINDRKYTSLFQMLSRAGYRKSEPNPIPPEQPELVGSLLSQYKEQLQYSDAELAELVDLELNDFRAWYYSDTSRLTLLPKIKRVSG